MAAAGPRRRKLIGHRRRVEDDAEDEGGHEVLDLDDDSLTDGSIGSDDDDAADDSDTSNIDEASPTAPNARKSTGNGAAKSSRPSKPTEVVSSGNDPSKPQAALADTEMMLNGLSIDDKTVLTEDMNFDEVQTSHAKESAPIIVSSSSAPQAPLQDRRRREHEEYRRKRDEDPAFVPNRGAFFMHDHRHAGPAANGFRPFARGGGRGGRGRGGFGAAFTPVHNQFHQHQPNFSDPTTNAPWTHDMHEVVIDHPPHRGPRTQVPDSEGLPNGNGVIPYAKQSHEPINRAMSVEKILGNVTVRVVLPTLNANAVFTGVSLKQYTKLPDHRPPLRRDKPVRISLPYHDPPLMPRYIYPASDRSFIFIPRALRPNAQQRMRGKGPRSNMGSMGGFSRRTSVFGGSFYGSAYSPSIALSRRSSIAPDMANGRDYLLSPTGSAISRPPLPMDNTRPVVRLPPLTQAQHPAATALPLSGTAIFPPPVPSSEASITDYPQPQTHPLPQKPIFQENRSNPIPMHQPRPQKAVSVENIEPSVQNTTQASQPYQGAFHQQVPPQLPNGGYTQDSHTRNPSYPSHVSTGTPLSQIPERAIHAAPFQPNTNFPPQNPYYGQPYPVVQQGGYYYPQPYGANVGPNAAAPAFVPTSQHGQPAGYAQPGQGDASGQVNGQPASTQGLVAQEVNGMVYYYEPSQLPPMTGFQTYPAAQPYAPGVMGGVVTPSPDGFYYQQPAPGMVYYSQ